MHKESRTAGSGGRRTAGVASALLAFFAITCTSMTNAAAASLDEDGISPGTQPQQADQSSANNPEQPEYRADELIQSFDPLGPTGSIGDGSVIPPMYDGSDSEQPSLFGD